MCGLRWGFHVSACAYPDTPSSVTMRTTGDLPMAAHLRSVIRTFAKPP